MKALFITSLMLAAGPAARAQRPAASPVPAAAVAAFRHSFPGATGARWQQRTPDYVVQFTQQQQVGRAVFTPAGGLVEKQQQVPYHALPPLARTAVAQRFPHRQLDTIYRVETAAGSVRYAVLVCRGKNKHGKDTDCQTTLFDQDGRPLKS